MTKSTRARTKLFFLAISTSLLFSFGASAAFVCEQPSGAARSVFSQSFSNPEIYVATECHDNIWRLLDLMRSRSAILPAAYVLYIFQTAVAPADLEQASLVWIYPRRQKVTEVYYGPWLFHVVLLAGQMVLDLDYEQSPVAIDVREYFARMFEASPDLYVRAIPVEAYLSDYRFDDAAHDWRYYLFDADAAYPARRVAEFLSEIHCPLVATSRRRGH